MAQSKAESFTAYLEEKQRLKAQRANIAALAPAGASPISLLKVLAAAPGGRMSLTDLQAAGGMSFLDFSQTLKRLADSGYLTVAGNPSQEIAELTKLGADVADLAR